ncbi:MAG: tyrosine-type recombinase/integrase, partial [Gammaproteobacteria bacterium]|nr:tyrosine-type recombinase/integrase [Gammaproteobacteria bacterium]
PHFFRHTCGQRIMERSTAVNPLQVVQAALGHSDIKNTAIYTRPTREQLAADMEAIS